MVEYINTVLNNNKELGVKIAEFKQNSGILRGFINSPIEVGKILSSRDLSISESFKEITIGLSGEFTKNKAIDLGKNKILVYYKELLDNIDGVETPFKDVIGSIVNELNNKLDIVYKNVDTDSLKRRKHKYYSNGLTTKYMTDKLNNICSGKLQQLNSNKSNIEFIYSLRELLSLVRLFNIDDLTKAWDQYNFKNHIIDSNLVENTVTDTYKSEVNIKETYNRTDTDIFRDYLEQIKTSNEGLFSFFSGNKKEIDVAKIINDKVKACNTNVSNENIYNGLSNESSEPIVIKEGNLPESTEINKLEETQILEVFSSIIDLLPRTYELLKEAIDKYNTKISSFVNEKVVISNILEKIQNEVITPYSNLEILATDYTNKMNNYIKCLENTLVINSDMKKLIINKALELSDFIVLYDKIYNFIDEATVVGQLNPAKPR